MAPRRFYRNSTTLNDRVAHAYFKYGCFCSNHPIVTIVCSIATLLLLSYPLTRLRLIPASASPFEIVTAENISDEALRSAVVDENDQQLSWLFVDSGGDNRRGRRRRSPLAYIQQIVVKSRVDPWNSFEMTPSDSVKAPLELSFDLLEKIQSFRYSMSSKSDVDVDQSSSSNSDNNRGESSSTIGLDDYCFRVRNPDLSMIKLHKSRFPSNKCLLLSPASLWGNDRQKFYEDNQIFETIFEPECTNFLCIRHLFIGMTGGHAGIKRHYRTNRQREIRFALTIVLYKYDESYIDRLRTHLSEDPRFSIDDSDTPASSSSSSSSSSASSSSASAARRLARVVEQPERDDKFILIYYLLSKDLSTMHIPLALSYIFLFVYLYFSVRKIEMVKSKWGLAFSAVFTIAASLVMASGICVNFDLTPRLWRADLFPYLAMILGIENTLCLTRSVVSTPVSLPVEERVAHGLSREGWLITKNFLIELAVVLVGVLTRIPEIQEFCTLGCIGLVVDFYMQLFFYAPCLTFDLLRFDTVEIQRLRIMQLSMNPVELVPYPPVKCPAMQMLTRFVPSALMSSWRSSGSVDEGDQDPVRRSRSMSSVAGTSAILPGGGGIGTAANNTTGTTGAGGGGTIATTSGGHNRSNMGHRRTASNTSDISVDIDSPLTPNLAAALLRRVRLPRRLKILIFWSRYRYCQRIFTVVMVVWIVWLALIVHQWHLIGKFSHSLDSNLEKNDPRDPSAAINNPPDGSMDNQSASASSSSGGSSAPTVESSWVHWALAQRTTFRWWPVLFNIYNTSLTGEYLVLLPRIVLNARVKPERAKAIRSGVEPAAASSGGNFDDASSGVGGDGQQRSANNPDTGGGGRTTTTGGGLGASIMNELGVRISWLEIQMLAVLIMSVGIFLTVGGFILYVCFVGGDSSTDSVYETDAAPRSNAFDDGRSKSTGGVGGGSTTRKMTHKRVGSKTLVDSVPIVFAKHEYDVEFVRSVGDYVVSACLDGRILIWDAKSGDVLRQARPYQSTTRMATEAMGISTAEPGATGSTEIRNRRAPNGINHPQSDNTHDQQVQPFAFLEFDHDETSRASIWCLDAQSQLIAVGYSNGDVELYDLRTGLLRGRYGNGTGVVGATQICLKGSHVIVARLNGQLDFMELRLSSSSSSPQRQYLQIYPVRSVTAHQRQINRLATTSSGVITASDDHTLKLFDLHKYSCVCTFYGHNAAVLEISIDHDMQMMYTSCADGLVCIWDLVDRCLVRTLPELSYTAAPVALAYTGTTLIGHGHDGSVWLWKKSTGELVTRMKTDRRGRKSTTNGGSSTKKDGKTGGGGTDDDGIDSGIDCDTSSLVVLNGNLAVSSSKNSLKFWDLEYKAVLREVKLGDNEENGTAAMAMAKFGSFGSPVKNLINLDGFSVLCTKGCLLYRVDFPVIRDH